MHASSAEQFQKAGKVLKKNQQYLHQEVGYQPFLMYVWLKIVLSTEEEKCHKELLYKPS